MGGLVTSGDGHPLACRLRHPQILIRRSCEVRMKSFMLNEPIASAAVYVSLDGGDYWWTNEIVELGWTA